MKFKVGDAVVIESDLIRPKSLNPITRGESCVVEALYDNGTWMSVIDLHGQMTIGWWTKNFIPFVETTNLEDWL